MQWDKQASEARQRRGCAFSTPERVGQDGVSLDPLHICPNRGPSLERDLFVGLADALVNQNRSHPNGGSWGCCSIQGKYWPEPQEVQHIIQQPLSSLRIQARTPAESSLMLEQLEGASAASLKTCVLLIGAAVLSWCGPPRHERSDPRKRKGAEHNEGLVVVGIRGRRTKRSALDITKCHHPDPTYTSRPTRPFIFTLLPSACTVVDLMTSGTMSAPPFSSLSLAAFS